MDKRGILITCFGFNRTKLNSFQIKVETTRQIFSVNQCRCLHRSVCENSVLVTARRPNLSQIIWLLK